MKNFTSAGKKIRLFESAVAPLIILHTFQDEGESVYQATKNITRQEFSLAAIGNLNWDDEMSPWPIPPISKDDTPCTGGADKYLKTFEEIILPEIFAHLEEKPIYIAAAGYSLAGLFAVYSMYRTEIFSRIASASGSFWYPKFLDFTQENKILHVPEKIYFSLGDKEAKTRNKILQTVEDNTRRLKSFYETLGIKTIFELNAGNHFQHSTERTAKAIAWILQD